MAKSRKEKASEAKVRGNTAAKRKQYYQAIIHYTEAIKLDSKDPTVLTNRSLCFLKLAQHFLALEDAKRAVKLQPDWSKGYYRQGQVYYSADKFEDAVKIYEEGIAKCPNDDGMLKLALEKTLEKKREKDERENKYTKIGVIIGVILGIIFIIGDEYFASYSVLVNYFWKGVALLVMVIAGAGCAEMYSQFWKMTSDALLMPDENWFKAATGGFDDEYRFEGEVSQSVQTEPMQRERRGRELDRELRKGVVIEEVNEDDDEQGGVKLEDLGEENEEDFERKKDK
ncbi:tetratricopeptide repeat protein 28-like [Ptychodera flava]|uniref:tetratricopeptide repeat protein 28-like n=1 Tax=Ptychodera flava TaxID=63121 RepID=UPI00396A61CE